MAKRSDPMAMGLSLLNRLASAPLLDRLGVREATEKLVYRGSRSGFSAATAAGRTFARRRGSGGAVRHAAVKARGVFDLTPTQDQEMIVGLVRELASQVLRPAAEKAESADETPPELLQQTTELGLTLINVPEELGGLSTDRSAVTGVLVAEALAEGDMGLAVSVLAPAAVSTAISLWGTADQQATYLPTFIGAEVPSAALTVAEPRTLFDPFVLSTTARKTPGGYVIDGLKSCVVRGASAELFIVAADLEGSGPALFLVESTAPGLSVKPDPGMGLRSAALTQLQLTGVQVGDDALLGAGDGDVYRECIRLSRIAWAALAVGTSKAVLDYVSDYVKTREAFGEPIAHRQSVAFMVANIAIELEGMRLTVYRAASRADLGLGFSRESALARRLASEHGMKIGTDGVQLLGGHGFVKEHPVERWYRDLRAVGVMEGSLLV